MRDWSDARITMSNQLVEGMVGQQTRIVQQAPEHWHDGEDAMLADYGAKTRRLDRWQTALSLVPRIWALAAFLALIPTLLSSIKAIEITAGVVGLIIATQAMSSLAFAVGSSARFWVSWYEIRELFLAGAARQNPRAAALEDADRTDSPAIVELADLRFSYTGAGRPVLSGVNAEVRDGDRILLEGPSGGGKTTLAGIISGLRDTSGGLVLVEGLDSQSLSQERWRRVVAAAPQFHENHVFGNTLAFNLLLGRSWPPSEDDLAQAREVCQELGLGALLDRMPNGLHQLVGETGWSLSHGERSRIFIARALLQNARLLVFDESFGALDPQTLMRCMQCAIVRSRALIVIAHP
jgi:ATP-binding cassette subfamily B protein